MKFEVKHFSNTFTAPLFFENLKDYGESNTDTSFIRPDISSARAIVGSYIGNNNFVGKYDFDNGDDTGSMLMTFLRSKSLDVTEIDNAYKMYLKNVDSLKRADVDKFIEDNKDKDDKSLRESIKKFFNQSNKDSNSQKVDSKVQN